MKIGQKDRRGIPWTTARARALKMAHTARHNRSGRAAGRRLAGGDTQLGLSMAATMRAIARDEIRAVLSSLK